MGWRWLAQHGRAPLDNGARLAEGSRLLGDHKRWRGLAMGTVACAIVARRLRLPPGSELPRVDQLPEALIPLLVLAHQFGLRYIDAVATARAFTLLDLAALRLRHPAARSQS